MSVRFRKMAWCLAILSLVVISGCTAGGGAAGGGNNNAAPDDGSNDNAANDNTANDNSGDGTGGGGGDQDVANDNGTDDGANDNSGGDGGGVGDNDNENDNSSGGGAGGVVPADLDADEVHASFAAIWSDFDQKYAHFPIKGTDWDAVRTQYEPQFQTALTTSEFLSRMAAMLGTLNDVNVWLEAGDDVVPSVTDEPVRNYAAEDVVHYFTGGLDQVGDFPLWHSWMENNLAYIGIDSFNPVLWEGLTDSDIDDLFALYADADGMVIDLRRNAGGNEIFAIVFGGRLTDSAYTYAYHKSKNESPDHDDFTALQPHILNPWITPPYTGTVACLIGEANAEVAEWFVLMMLERPFETTFIGDATRGVYGYPLEQSLDNGIKYFIPTREGYRADQTTTIEGVGIPPTAGFAIAPGEGTSYTDDSDLVLERAIELLGP